MKSKTRKKNIDILDKKNIKNVLVKNIKNVLVDKLSVLMRLSLEDYVSCFDLINALSLGAEFFVTNNEIILKIRDKLMKRIPNFKILTSDEVSKILANKEIAVNEYKASYTG